MRVIKYIVSSSIYLYFRFFDIGKLSFERLITYMEIGHTLISSNHNLFYYIFLFLYEREKEYCTIIIIYQLQ